MAWIRMKKVVIVIVVQVFVMVFVLSVWQMGRDQHWEGKQEWIRKAHEGAERVGKYVLLYENPSGPNNGQNTKGGPDSRGSKGHGNTANVRELKDRVASRTGDVETGNVERKDEINDRSEEDPNVARGFLDEFVVSYRSDNKKFLMVDDDNANNDTSKVNTSNKTGEEVVPLERVLPDNSVGNNNSVITSDDEDYKFKSYDGTKPFTITMKDDNEKYFENIGSVECYIEGTDINNSVNSGGKVCRCRGGYFGVDCGIPEAAWYNTYLNKYPETRLVRRAVPRRVINGLPVNHEFVMFEARLHELYPVVDVFVIAESNYTSHGDPKKRLFLDKLRRGYMKDFQDKIVYMGEDKFPDRLRKDGWLADSYLRVQLGHVGIPLLKGLRDDDLFVLCDADELPSREVISFLRLYDGYPEPISFAYQWNVYGFFWKVQDRSVFNLNWKDARVATVMSVATMGMLRKVMLNDVVSIRRGRVWGDTEATLRYARYRDEGHLLNDWVIGTMSHYAGWHCSWCFSPVDIVRKMNSAQAEDKPRYGDIPEKKNLTYIASRISKGIWFDDKERYIPATNPKAKFYAPPYLLAHPEEYRAVLFHPDHPLNKNQKERAWQ